MLFENKNSSSDKELTAGKKNLFSASLLENYRPLLDQKNSNPFPNSHRKSSEPSSGMPTLINNKILRRRHMISKKSEDLHHNPMASKDFMTPSEYVSTFDSSKESKWLNINELSDENQELNVEFPKKSFLKKMLNAEGDLRRSITGESKRRSNQTEVSLNSLMHAYMSNSNRNKL
jgi:hypothetical protein